MRFSLRIHMYL